MENGKYLGQLGKVHFIAVSGDKAERTRQHIALVKNRVGIQPIKYYTGFIDQVIKHSVHHHSPWLREIILKVVPKVLRYQFKKNLNDEELAVVKTLAEAADLPYDKALNALLISELFPYLIAKASPLFRAVPIAPMMGCSSFIALKEATRERKLIHTRNLDFPGYGTWDRFPMVVVNRPRKGIPFISIASAGVQIVVTGINSEGLALGLHMQYTKDVASRGVPILRITEEILSTCKTVRDAIKLTEGTPKTMAGWTIILSQAKDDAVCAIEFSASKKAVVLPRSNHLCYANNYQDSKMAKSEYYLSQNYYEHNLSRCQRMDQVMDSLDGKFTLAEAFFLMTDRFDPFANKVRASSNTVGQIHSISSVIFVPEEDQLWMADARAPTNLTHAMIGFKISELFQNRLVSLGPLKKELAHPNDIFVPTKENQDAAHRAYTDASVAWFDHMDIELTLSHLQKAIDSDPTEAIYYFVRGLFLLRAGRPSAAQASFEKALTLETLKIRQANSRLWIARSIDLQKNRSEAVRQYQALLAESAYKDIYKKARRGLAHSFSSKDAARIDPFMPFADAYL